MLVQVHEQLDVGIFRLGEFRELLDAFLHSGVEAAPFLEDKIRCGTEAQITYQGWRPLQLMHSRGVCLDSVTPEEAAVT